MGSDKAFIFRGRLFMYITKSKGLGIDLWETPCFTVPQSEEIAVPISHSQLKLNATDSNKTADKIKKYKII